MRASKRSRLSNLSSLQEMDAMAVVTGVDHFLDVVRKSKVLNDEKLSQFIERLSAAEPPLDRPEQVATRLYKEGLLSYFQSKQLLQGRWRRFIIGQKYKL